MAGYQTAASPRPVMRSGPPATPVVNRDLIYPRAVPAEPKPVEVRVEPEGIILPPPVRPSDFEFITPTTLHQLRRLVADVTGVSVAEIKSIRRLLPVVKARHIFMWLAKRYTSHSYPKVGRLVGGRDHTTVMHGFRRVERVIVRHEIEVVENPYDMAVRLWAADWTGV